MSHLLPATLQRGDIIGMVGPAGPWHEETFRTGVQILSELGFQTTFPRNLLDQQGYLAGSDRHRHNTFTEIWRNPDVKAVMAVRGGYGSLRILSEIDYDLIKEYPIVAAVNMEGLPTPQLQNMRSSLREKIVLRMTKRR